ncbi:hypothetical protein GRX03_09225 [Halovenus sp. WSH3]|uniref:histidine kinase n=1 Tax=Halovenus carboxidivorans TaxID=2692199 RepID=A0A6B0T139_9EURY|nr:sensor histidine kinase [Halovenus carboxidivorans]MXR51784.1 hypothetical protein [Halovenus carboxidivorans]
MVSAIAALLWVMIASGGALCALGYASVRWWDEPGSTLFGLYVGLWGALPIIDSGANALFGVAGLSGLLWVVTVVPWFLFTLQYTGRQFGRRSWAALLVPAVGIGPWLWSLSVASPVPAFEAVGILVFVYYAAVATVGALLVLQAANRYGHLSLSQGALLALVGVIPTVTMNTFGVLARQFGDAVLFSIYAGGLLSSCLAAGLALFWDDVFDSTPAAGTVGERAVIRETDDLVLITDDEGDLVVHNEAAASVLPAIDAAAVGRPVENALGIAVEELAAAETVELQTTAGRRQFDPQVTGLTDQHDRRIGSMLSLRDITDREIRRQRLAVLNRIVRHNLRNQASVIKANTEAVADELTEDRLLDRLDTAADSVDSLTALSRKAKTVEAVLSEGGETTAVELRALLADIVADSARRWPEATVTVEECPEGVVETDRRALEFVLANLVENAVEHADTDSPTVELRAEIDPEASYPVEITVADDGPGIPDQEVDVLEAGTETQLKHGTGIGLWVTNWTVRELGGELSFPRRGPDGSTVAVRLPDRPTSTTAQAGSEA